MGTDWPEKADCQVAAAFAGCGGGREWDCGAAGIGREKAADIDYGYTDARAERSAAAAASPGKGAGCGCDYTERLCRVLLCPGGAAVWGKGLSAQAGGARKAAGGFGENNKAVGSEGWGSRRRKLGRKRLPGEPGRGEGVRGNN